MSSTPIVISTERPDQPQVQALLQELDTYLGTLYEPDANHILGVRALLAPEVSFLVAQQGERVVGCAAVRRIGGDSPYGEIKRMMVAPAWRGQRIGERLLQSLESMLVSDGIRSAMLETGGLQTAAVRLYERFGYRRRAAFGDYPDNGLSVFFEKALTP